MKNTPQWAKLKSEFSITIDSFGTTAQVKFPSHLNFLTTI